jgi:hypothetical protein
MVLSVNFRLMTKQFFRMVLSVNFRLMTKQMFFRMVLCLFQVDDETNILQDGTLIDLCGATLLWRSHEGLEKSPVSYIISCLFIVEVKGMKVSKQKLTVS